MRWIGMFGILSCAACLGANDADGDGHVSVDAGGMDCNDRDSSVSPAGVELCGDGVDQDCSGGDLLCSDFDRDGDRFSPNEGDCNDDRPDINPGAKEQPYNGVDDDCNLDTPDDDLDGDGFHSLGGGDCNDGDPTIFPGADEVLYDGIDQDCSGSDADDIDFDGFVAVEAGGNDCNDFDGTIHPDAVEIPFDLADQDCDGSDQVGIDAEMVSDVAKGQQLYASSVSNGSGYLVVWSDRRDNLRYNIWGRFLASDGDPLGAAFEIRDQATYDGYYPRVAFDGTQYLVVWEENTPASSRDIMGQIIDGTGALIGPVLALGNSVNYEAQPNVAYGNGTYLVTWYLSNPQSIASRTVSTAGTLGTVNTVQAGSVNTTHAVHSDGSTFLVAWAEYVKTTYEIRAQVVSAGGINNLVSPVDVTVGGYHLNPGIAWDGVNYLVVFDGNSAITGQFLSPVGVPTITAADTNFVISDAVGYKTQPRVVYADGAYLVSFFDNRWGSGDIYRQRIGTDATALDSSTDTNLPLVATTAYETEPWLATDGTFVLATWARSQSDYDIMGQIIAP